jgi:plasmid stability protein
LLSLAECRDIIQAHLDAENLKSDVELALFDKHREGEFCFAFTINSAEFIKTGNHNYCLVGAGPTLVDRRDGAVIEMANNGSMENYEKRGDPYNYLTHTLCVTGTCREGLRRETFKFLRDVTGETIEVCRDILNEMVEGEPFVFDAEVCDKRKLTAQMEKFRGLGFNVRRLPSFEVRNGALGEEQAVRKD